MIFSATSDCATPVGAEPGPVVGAQDSDPVLSGGGDEGLTVGFDCEVEAVGFSVADELSSTEDERGQVPPTPTFRFFPLEGITGVD